MSPASSGNLEVERYIGACLISQNRSKNVNVVNNKSREQFYSRDHFIPDIYHGNYVNLDGRFRIQRCNSVDGWAGGMPLISFANHQRRGGRRLEQNDAGSCSPRVEDQHSPLARLAVHTQGAPLILSKSYNHRKNKVHRNNATPKSIENTNHRNKSTNKCQDTQNNNVNNGVDAISVTSDESSGSANLENCLPRIIKPRKRRKKDRKPPLLGRPLGQDGFSTDSASPDIDTPTGIVPLRPFVPFTFDPYTYRSVPDSPSFTNTNNVIDRYQIFNELSETPKLHHSFEDIEELDDEKDVNGNQPTSTCQCRYCDPTGQIWDVDRNCYSPFLTPPNNNQTFQFPIINFEMPSSYLSPVNNPDDHCLAHSMSSISLDEESVVQKHHQVVSKSEPSSPRSTSDLEVSTEIVTSLNGHRDLEIKFFSTSSNSAADKMHDKSATRNCGNKCEIRAVQCAVNNECKFLSEE